MKKLYSNLALTFALAAAVNVVAQPTITSVAVPQPGYTYNMISDTDAVDLPTFTVSAGSASAQTWNYSGQFNNVYGETTSFMTPSSGAGSSSFPNATVAVPQPNGTDWVYFVGNSSGFYIDGAHVVQQGAAVDVDYVPNAVFMATPSTYGYNNHLISYATFTATVSGQTVQVRHSSDRTLTGDAFGSLTTPTATYNNTLRLKTYEKTIDSVFFNVLGTWSFFTSQVDSTWTYAWLQNSADAQLMQIDINASGAVTKAQYLQSFSNGVAQINLGKGGFKVYPNPATNMAYLSYENKSTGPVTLQMYDMSGRLVGDLLNENQPIGAQKVSINVESMHLPKGVYFLRLMSNDGLQTIRLSVQ